ncbi:MAG: hypothetical protein U0640_15695 [Phycisphaerales bacterium]
MTVRSVAILFHERATDAMVGNYRLWTLVSNWERMGIRVEYLFGIGRETDADLLFPHLDLSYIPDDYWAFIQRHPRVVNRAVRDIRKTVYSTNRVGRDEEHAGPVIVKTVHNCGGFSDVWLNTRSRVMKGASIRARVLAKLSRQEWLGDTRFRFARTLPRYFIYDSVRKVPRAVFENQHLIVEKFLPQREGDSYVMNMWIVFGDRGVGRILRASDPYVKNANATLDEFHEPPEEIREWQERLGLTYGKMDFVMHEGKAVLIDVNTTPTVTGDARSEEYRRLNEGMAAGVDWFERSDRLGRA